MSTPKDLMPFKFVDYVDIMPGGSYKRPTDEERERLRAASEKFKEIAKEQGVTFKITKGDEQ